MLEVLLFILFITLLLFIGIYRFEPRTILIGYSFFLFLISLAIYLFSVVIIYSETIYKIPLLSLFLFCLLLIVVFVSLIFPTLIICIYFVEGIKVIKKEGFKFANLLSLLFAILLCIYLVIWPQMVDWVNNTLGNIVYKIIGFSVFYLFSLMAAYVFSSLFNLVHLKKQRKVDYIVVLGSGLLGSEVSPLLAARIDKGIQIHQQFPESTLIMSGGQGKDELISEAQAMTLYAIKQGVDKNRILQERNSVSTKENLMFSYQLMNKNNPKIVIVSNSYHVFRALLYAKKLHIPCIGYGAKTKLYFTLNALMREFVAYFKMTLNYNLMIIILFALFEIILNTIIYIKS